jgi:phage terminase Nu1 subunit (DNA packaging protein)
MTLFETLPQQTAEEITKSAFASLIGVTPGRVSQMVREGLPVLPSGRLPREAALTWYRSNVTQRADTAKHSATVLQQAKMEGEQLRSDLLRLELDAKRGVLVDRKAVERTLFERGRAERDAHLAWVQRVAPQLATELDVDLAALFAALDREMRRHLAELADTPLSELAPDA